MIWWMIRRLKSGNTATRKAACVRLISILADKTLSYHAKSRIFQALCASTNEEDLQPFLEATMRSGTGESTQIAAQTLKSDSLSALIALLTAVHASVDGKKDALPFVQAEAANPKASAVKQFELFKGRPFHDPEVPMLTFLKKQYQDGLWCTDRVAVIAAVKLIALAACHLITDRTRAIALVMQCCADKHACCECWQGGICCNRINP